MNCGYHWPMKAFGMPTDMSTPDFGPSSNLGQSYTKRWPSTIALFVYDRRNMYTERKRNSKYILPLLTTTDLSLAPEAT